MLDEVKELEWRKTDLHVHTPASKCYRGPSEDETYLEILRTAKAKKISAVAITDHNSIEGYKRLLKIKDDFLRQRDTLSKNAGQPEIDKKIRTANKNLSLFQDILILPGVEFEAKPGVHLLVIFDEKTSTDDIQKFIEDGGYDKKSFGEEDPRGLANWDVIKLYEQSTKYDCMVIDAHTDSDKGLWNSTKGTYRINCFRAEQLCAICYKSDQQKENINQNLQQRDYSRKTPISFVKFSDAHNPDDVGKQVTWVRLANIDFQSIKVAFANPSELVSDEAPTVQKTINRLLSSPKSFGIPDIRNAKDKEYFKQLCCALYNAQGGYILLGITENKARIGIDLADRNEIKDYIDNEIIPCFDCLTALDNTRINYYPLQNRKTVISIHITSGKHLISINEDHRIYYIRNGKPMTLTASDVQTLIEEKHAEEIEHKVQKSWILFSAIAP